MSDSALLNQIINLRNNCCFVGAKPSTFMRSLEKPSPLPILFWGGKYCTHRWGFVYFIFLLFIFKMSYEWKEKRLWGLRDGGLRRSTHTPRQTCMVFCWLSQANLITEHPASATEHDSLLMVLQVTQMHKLGNL